MSSHPACRVCHTPVRAPHEGVVLRFGKVEAALCAQHARMVQTSAVVVGKAALRGLEQVLEREHPEAVRTFKLAREVGAQVVRAKRKPVKVPEVEYEPVGGDVLEPDVVYAAPRVRARVTGNRAVRHARKEDVIEGEYIEVKS